jgi:hypothetical protein
MAEMSYLDPGTGSSIATSGGGFDLAAFGRAAGDLGVGTYASGAGSILGFVGSLVAARAAKKASAYNSEIIRRNSEAAATALETEALQRERNAALLLQDITFVQQAQAEQERQQRLSQEFLAGQTRAIIGSSGLLMRGSPIAVMEFNLQQSEREILAGRYRAQVQERALYEAAEQEGYAATMARYGAGERLRVGKGQAVLARYGGSRQAAAGRLGAVSGLLSGGARTYTAYERHQALKGPVASSGRDFE